MGRQVRIGIDVGGTFTKAVVLDDDTHEIIAQAVVATTHTAAEGVAAGVIEAFRRSLASARVTPTEVDRKSTRLNSSHLVISYAVFCLKKKKKQRKNDKRHIVI